MVALTDACLVVGRSVVVGPDSRTPSRATFPRCGAGVSWQDETISPRHPNVDVKKLCLFNG
ncbi:hypothetical protein ZHAS_00007062 [Anopheles sinensis]|uniref:Uncharacterized protein n=1 Tax=Anopheles sinensis TaxID=74873 RepID=A0A084VNS7_ANOSI|nr:hypothetical protein ZHAS_00007062 [Anopheles sinensis]